MDQQKIIAALEARAKKLGMPIAELCRKAKVHPTTFSRWKWSIKNPTPVGATVKSLNALEEVLASAEQVALRQSGRAA